MSGTITDIDHLMVHVHDVEAAGKQFEDLGFHVTPRSELTALGLANRCILFQPANSRCANFIELMAIERPDVTPPFMHAILGEAEGPVSFVLATDDVDQAFRDLSSRGVRCQEPLQIRREWRLADDDIVYPAFGVCIPDTGQFAPYWNLCQYHTRDLYVRPDLTRHPNGAARIQGFGMAVPDPALTAEQIGRAWAVEAVSVAGVATLRPGDVALHFTAQTAASPPAPLDVSLIGAWSGHTGIDQAELFGLKLRVTA